jgi:hypothetical protein
MSFVTVTSRFSAVNPKVWIDGDALHARTNLFLQLLCLFFWCKTVVVDRRARVMTIHWRYFWFLRRTGDIAFDDITHFEYRYGSIATAWSWFGHVHDSLEQFSIDAALTDRTEMRLFSFRGQGAHQTGAVGVLLGDSAIDFQGDQGARSLAYIDLLQEFTGKGLSRFSRGGRRRIAAGAPR